MLGLLGIQGFEIKTQNQKEFQAQFEEILQDEDIGVIMLNEKLLIRFQDYFKRVKILKRPMIVEIPDMKGPFEDNYFQDLIKKFIALSV